jgi:hypothetical protein
MCSLSCALSGCGAPLIAGLSLSEWATAGSIISTAATGKGFSEYAMDAATGQDCRIVEGIVRADRHVCERWGSPASRKDWKGLAHMPGVPGTTVEVGVTEDPGSERRDSRGG